VRRQDWIITAGVVTLAAFMPMAIGGVLVGAYIVGEAIVCLMLLEWAAEMRRAPEFPARIGASSFAIPIGALAGYMLFQLAPLPPPVLRVVSPTAYEVYARAFPNWPRERPYANLNAIASTAPKPGASDNDFVILPTPGEVKGGAAIPFAPKPGDSGAASTAGANVGSARSGGRLPGLLHLYGTRWRPLTLSPPQTWGALLMFATSAGLFLLVGFFPVAGGFSAEAEASFRRILAIAMLAIGAAIAILGLIQQATWNGKILWIYIPLDWGAPIFLDSQRASGPFVNPDHFAGYLAAIFPLALAGALFPDALFKGKWSTAFRIISASLGFLIFVAVLASQSRAGWISILVATTLVAALSIPSQPADGSQRIGSSRLRQARVALGTLTVMLVLAAIFIGASAVENTGLRLHSTLTDVSNVAGRIDTWKAGLKVVRDFWLTGIGLAAWPEIFAHYSLAPWSANFYYETENDYLQFVAETGVVGLLLAGWLAYAVVTRLKRGLPRLSPSTRSLEAALIAGLAVMAVVEFFDFDLQIPAIAFTFAILGGLAVRLAAGDEDAVVDEAEPARNIAPWAAAAAIVLLIACLWQPREPYPYNLTEPESLAEARHMLLLYPANPLTHKRLVSLIGDRMEPATRQREMETAVWLDPTNPSPRDALAQTLERDGKITEELAEIKTSVFNSPSSGTHRYLASRVVPWLSPAMEVAIKIGYQRAVDANFEGALAQLGVFYEQLGQYFEEAAMDQRAAGQTDDPDAKYPLLVAAGHAWALAGNMPEARMQLREAAELEPDNRVAYEVLINQVFAPKSDFDGMTRTVKEAIQNGVDGYEMWTAVASTAAQMGNSKVAEDALTQALVYRPGSIKDVILLGNLYIASGDSDSAVRTMQQAVDMRSDSAAAYFNLGRAEEAAYDYGDAETAYKRAVELAPDDASYKAGYDSFKKRMKPAEQHASDPAP
jgi:O-antigen ligase/tetratricopeptide (TPR) repeat protein